MPALLSEIVLDAVRAQAVMKCAKELGIEMPICETVNHVLFDGLELKPAMEKLMSRPYKEEGI